LDRTVALRGIAIVLAGWGIWRALYIPGMLGHAPSTLLLLGFLLQAICGIAAGIGVWRARSWAPLLIVLLGLSIALTAFIEGFVLEIAAALYALLGAVAAILLALLLAAWVRGQLAAGGRDG
jgi:hypothetical protein